jgi:hypothetical protein
MKTMNDTRSLFYHCLNVIFNGVRFEYKKDQSSDFRDVIDVVLGEKFKNMDMYKSLTNFYPGFEELLKKLAYSLYNIYQKLGSLNDYTSGIGVFVKRSYDEKVKELLELKSSLSDVMKEIDNVLLGYKNAFVTLSFQIASTLFGYGVSILQIFMQNFPEKLNDFTPSAGSAEKPTNGLQELDKLKEPFKSFVSNGDVKSQEFDIQPSDYETQLATLTPPLTSTPFNILLPLGNQKLKDVQIFKVSLVAKVLDIPPEQMSQTGVVVMGGKKQRRLLLPPPSRPLQSNKRPKKRKTIKNRPNATNTTHKTTKKNKRYTNNKNNNNNKTKKNKQVKNILTKSNQKRNKRHKRSIRKV